MSASDTEPLAIALACHDPAGAQIQVTQTELFNHLLVLGATGSGKTSRVILPAFDDLCRTFNGLLVIDGKRDADYLAGIKESCVRHGRPLVEIDGSGEVGVDLFGPMRSRGLEGVDEVAERLCFGVPVALSNRYWDLVFGKVLRGALSMLLLARPKFSFDDAVDWLERYMLSFSSGDREISSLEGRIMELLDESGDTAEARQLQSVLRVHQMWSTLDYRTRSNHQSMATTVVDILRRAASRNYFAARTDVDLGEALDEGKVVLARVHGFGESELARLIASSLKAAFFRGLFTRTSDAMPWGLILDDWSLSVSGGSSSDSSDSVALAHIRSKRGFVLAACQSLAEIDAKIGRQEREAAVANFGSLLFMRSRDLETDLLAHRSFVVPDREVSESWKMGSVQSQTLNAVRRFEGSLLPPGKLSRLATGEAWVSVCGNITEQSVMLAPYWEKRDTWDALL